MITDKIFLLEYNMVNNTPVDKKEKEAIKQLKVALKQIDFNSEIIPLSDHKRLTELFESLLNRQLNQAETSIIEHLIES